MYKNIIAVSLLLSLLLVGLASGHAEMVSATLRGRVVGPDGGVVLKAHVKLANPITGQVTEGVTDEQGVFTFYNLPHNAFVLTVEAESLATLTRNLDIHGDGVIELGDLPLSVSELKDSVNITATESVLVESDNTSSHHDIDKTLITRFPAVVSSRGMEQILLSTPGFIADENGRFHFRGSHGQVGYVIDGVPINDQMQATYSNSLDPNTVSAIEVTTGGIPAEYGDRAATVKVTTKSGLESSHLFFGNASYGLSSFGTNEAGMQFGGATANKRFGYFTSFAGSVSDRFLDPINFDNLHNRGNSERLFSRLDFQATPRDTVTLNFALGRTDHEVPNLLSQQLAGQDQSALLRDGSISLAWQRIINAHAFFDARGFYRSSQQQLFGSSLDTPIASSYARRLTNYGVNANFNYERGSNRLKTGFTASVFPLRENLNFSLTSASYNAPYLTASGAPDTTDDPANANNPNPNYNPLLRAFDTTRVNPLTSLPGVAFLLNGQQTGKEFAAYAQDTYKFKGFTINAGLRASHYNMFVSETSVQPRIGLSYFVKKTGTVFRASYDRLFIPPENEGLVIASSPLAAALTAGGINTLLKAERQNSYEVGFQQGFKHWLRIDGAYYTKDAHNVQDNDQFFNTGVLFPIAFNAAKLKGFDLRLDVPDHRGFSGYWSFGTNSAIFSPPFAGGLLTGDVPTAPFRIDHDQKFSSQWSGQYNNKKRGWWMALGGRYDSGLVAEVEAPAAIAQNPDIAFGLNFVHPANDPLAPYRIDPRTVWNYSVGIDLFRETKHAVDLQFNVLNLTDKQGLYNFLSPFGGTHVIPPRTFGLKLKFNF